MEKLMARYERKLTAQGLCGPGAAIQGGLDADLTWSRGGDEVPVLEEIVRGLAINSILFARPAEPYGSILDLLAEAAGPDGAIHPEDCEMRTFIHDIPVAAGWSADAVVPLLKRRKAVIVPGAGLVTHGSVSPEQAFISFSSVCFSGFVKFFTDYAYDTLAGAMIAPKRRRVFNEALGWYRDFVVSIETSPVHVGPFTDPDAALAAMDEAGRLTVATRMVDSFFGNISCRLGDTILVSQTGSSLDELPGLIDACPMDGSSTAAITASSELPAHRAVYEATDARVILHGHPKFCVIMSMICREPDCPHRGACHIRCDRHRSVGGVPIVPGEVGGGPNGLYRTLPAAMTGRGAIVWGHGLFTSGRADFREAFASLIDIERMCLEEYRALLPSSFIKE